MQYEFEIQVSADFTLPEHIQQRLTHKLVAEYDIYIEDDKPTWEDVEISAIKPNSTRYIPVITADELSLFLNDLDHLKSAIFEDYKAELQSAADAAAANEYDLRESEKWDQ